MVVRRGKGEGLGKMGDGEREVQASSHGLTKSQGGEEEHTEYSQPYRNSVVRGQMAATPVVSTASCTEVLSRCVVHLKRMQH